MRLERITSIFNVLFFIAGILTILEFFFIRGMFTAPIMMGLVGVLGVINIALELVGKHYMTAIHFLITSVALCMGYTVLGP